MRFLKGIETGIIFDGAFGQTFNDWRVCELLARVFDMPLTEYDKGLMSRIYDYEFYQGETHEDDFEQIQYLSSELINKVNDKIAADGFMFEWHEGDFFLNG